MALPHVPGIDIAGTIVTLGDGVTGWAAGDQVIGFLPMASDGAAAEFVVAPVAVLAPAPGTIPLASAVALPAVALTGLLRPGGVIVTTAAPAAPDRGVRAVGMQVRADADQLATIAKKVDAGEIRVDVSATHPRRGRPRCTRRVRPAAYGARSY